MSLLLAISFCKDGSGSLSSKSLSTRNRREGSPLCCSQSNPVLGNNDSRFCFIRLHHLLLIESYPQLINDAINKRKSMIPVIIHHLDLGLYWVDSFFDNRMRSKITIKIRNGLLVTIIKNMLNAIITKLNKLSILFHRSSFFVKNRLILKQKQGK